MNKLNKKDLSTSIASKIFQCPIKEVSREMRIIARNYLFMKTYGNYNYISNNILKPTTEKLAELYYKSFKNLQIKSRNEKPNKN